MATPPKTSPVPHRTLPTRPCWMTPVRLVSPTTSSEVAMAVLVGRPTT